MGTIVVSELVSLDGVVEAPGGEPGYRHTGWAGDLMTESELEYKLDEALTHDALLLGRRTYVSFAEGWSSREGEFADRMNRMPKFVASSTLEAVDWENSTLLEGDVAQAVTQLKKEFDGKLLVGGSRTLVNTLKQYDLVDEYRLMIFPIVLGSGMRLFDETFDATTLKLVDTKPFESGVVVLTYTP